MDIPETPVGRDAVISELEALRSGDADWRAARVFSLVYHLDDAHEALLKRAYTTLFSENALNPMAFKSLKRLESEVVSMSASLLHGGPRACGVMTSGGSESLLLAVLAARDKARVRRPEIVMPRTAHVALEKAAHLFGLTVRRAPLRDDFTADPAAMARLVTRDTVLLVASAPQYPHGVLDPVAEIGRLALEKRLPLHVDACIGGFFLPWAERLGRPVAPWDFRVPGVTSISADLHKFGFAAKGASVLLYRDMAHMRHQFFVSTEFPGGVYASPGLAGTRPGGAIAAAWAALRTIGAEGYTAHAKAALETADRYAEGIRAVPGLEVMGRPVMSILAFRSADPAVEVFSVASRMEEKGWHLDRQHKPDCLHLTLGARHEAVRAAFLSDLRESVDWARAHPEAASLGSAAAYGAMAKLPARGLVREGVLKVMERMYGPDGASFDGLEADPLAEAASRVLRFGEKVSRFLSRR